jgi:hypothetical protein
MREAALQDRLEDFPNQEQLNWGSAQPDFCRLDAASALSHFALHVSSSLANSTYHRYCHRDWLQALFKFTELVGEPPGG